MSNDLLQVPHRLQLSDGYCLPACVQMVLAYWGIGVLNRISAIWLFGWELLLTVAPLVHVSSD